LKTIGDIIIYIHVIIIIGIICRRPFWQIRLKEKTIL